MKRVALLKSDLRVEGVGFRLEPPSHSWASSLFPPKTNKSLLDPPIPLSSLAPKSLTPSSPAL